MERRQAMDARISRIKVAPENADALIAAFAGSALPALREIAGYAGHSLGVDRESGDSQAVTFWESRSSLDASEEAGGRMRTSTVQAGGGSVVSVDRFEIALMERFTQPSAPSFLRVIRGEVDPNRLDELARLMRDDSLEVVRSQPGARAMVLGIDRSSGRFAITSVWESAEAREASRAAIDPMRVRVFGAVGVEKPEFCAYEVVSVEFVGVGARSD
jgi:heme-degrading monooxygenase HmoA